MAVPFRRTGKTAKRLRRANFKLTAPTMTPCTTCGALVRPHYVCKACGHYRNVKIVRA